MSYYLFHTEAIVDEIPSSPQFTGPFKSPTAAMEYGLYHFLDRWTLINGLRLMFDMFDNRSNSVSVPVNVPKE